MALGMTYDDYWNGDNELPKYYREKYKIEAELQAQNMWVQGAYFYESMLRAAPLYNFMSKNPEPLPYPEHPYPATAEQRERYAAAEKQKKYNRNLEWMKARTAEINSQFESNL